MTRGNYLVEVSGLKIYMNIWKTCREKDREVRLTSSSNDGYSDGCRGTWALNQDGSQDADHQTTDGVVQQLALSKNLSRFFATEETEGRTHQVQGTDEEIEESYDGDGFDAPINDDAVHLFTCRQLCWLINKKKNTNLLGTSFHLDNWTTSK